CEKFIAADKIINGEIEGNLTMEEIKDPKFNKYCCNQTCRATEEIIDGLSEDLFNQLGKEIEEEYYEYFAMWLSDKLFKIAKDNPQIKDITLNSAYAKYLKNNNVNFNYWSLLDIREGLKGVNLMHMKQFYKLLNDICKAIVYYKQNDDDIEKFISNSSDCYNQYSSLYKSVPKCNSYLHLLDNLKKTYEGFKNSVHDKIKNEYPHLAERLQTLTIENTDSYLVGKFKAFDFNSSECNPQNTKTGGLSHKNGSENSKSGQTSLDSGKGIMDGGSGGGSSDRSKETRDQAGTHPSGKSNEGWLGNWGMSFNLTSYMPSAFDVYQSSKNILTSATNQVSNAYHSAMTIVQDTYDKTVDIAKNTYGSVVSTVKDTYTRSTNYIIDGFNSITSQLSSLGSFSQLGDNPSESNSLGGGTDTSDQSQPNPKHPVNPPQSPPQSTPPQTPPQTPSDPSSPKSIDSQTIPTHISKNSDRQSTSNAGKGVPQIPLSAQGTLPSSSTGPSTQGNGNTTGIVVKDQIINVT
ncbi:hypothetical protein YYG_05178, partial [Plasmodium vinckei petteri]